MGDRVLVVGGLLKGEERRSCSCRSRCVAEEVVPGRCCGSAVEVGKGVVHSGTRMGGYRVKRMEERAQAGCSDRPVLDSGQLLLQAAVRRSLCGLVYCSSSAPLVLAPHV